MLLFQLLTAACCCLLYCRLNTLQVWLLLNPNKRGCALQALVTRDDVERVVVPVLYEPIYAWCAESIVIIIIIAELATGIKPR